ncbi:MAG: hypothetical protein HY326_07410, partial [Chloroflexi bacterium]|nr:hypothetical protein [Chloroflexota bacterium]
TWVMIAIVALVGWLTDELLMFLTMHPISIDGVSAWLSHAWYAIPILGALFLLTHFRPRPELLSLTIYDESGLPIHREGDFHLDKAVADATLLSFRGIGRREGLHRIDLSSGPVVYFLRERGLTLMACFSAPVREQQLAAGVQLLRNKQQIGEEMLSGLTPEVAALAINMLTSPAKRDLVDFLWHHHRTALTAGDLAAYIGVPEESTIEALAGLVELGIVQHFCACDLDFYRLTTDKELLERLSLFFVWQDSWVERAQWMERTVGKRGHPSRPLKVGE